MKIISVYAAIKASGAVRVAAGIGIILALAVSSGGAYNIDGIIDSLSGGVLHPVREGETAPSRGALGHVPVRTHARTRVIPGRGADTVTAPGGIETARINGRGAGTYIPLIHPLFPINGIVFPVLGGLLILLVIMQRNYDRIKRLLDIVGSIMVLSAFFPILAVAAIMIKIDSSGPILIRQVRVGVNRRSRVRGRSRPGDRRRDENLGSLFTILKLRTMRADAESSTGPVWARENDDRITRVGRILRKTHIDEIPQFVNVLKGDMCIIGPRPERPLFMRRLSTSIKNYDRRLRVKPGITGLAQVRYRYAASIEDTKKKLRYDLLYVDKMGLGMDLRILANTVNMVVSMRGAR